MPYAWDDYDDAYDERVANWEPLTDEEAEEAEAEEAERELEAVWRHDRGVSR